MNLGGAYLKSSIQTPIISIAKASTGQCLSFYYFQNSFAKLLINKINLDGTIQRVLDKEYSSIGNNWRKVLITIQSSTDYFIEFNGATGKSPESIVAIDDIQLNTMDKCRVLECQFDNENGDEETSNHCQPNLVLGNSVNSRLWSLIEDESMSSSGDDYSSSVKRRPNSYLRADVSQIRYSQNTFYGFPLVLPAYSSMCASFKYILNGSSTVELRLGLIQTANNELTYIWKETTNQSLTHIFLKKI